MQELRRTLLLPGFWTSSNACLSAWLLGFCSVLLTQQTASLTLGALLLAVLLALFLRWRSTATVIAFTCAVLWASYCFSQHQAALLPEGLQSKNLTLVGQIVGLPRGDEQRMQFDFKIQEIVAPDNNSTYSEKDLAKFALAIGGTAQLSCYRCPLTFEPSQVWRFTVRLKRPSGYASWGAFDFEKLLFRKQVIGRGYVRLKADNELLYSERFTIDQYRWQIKQRLLDLVADGSSEHQTSGTSESPGLALILALMTGDKSLMSQQQRDVFQNTGVSHLIAISGLHIGLVFVAVAWLFKWLLMPFSSLFNLLPRQHLVLLPALMAAGVYAGLAGFAVSTQRAFTMLLVFAACRILARDLSLIRVLQLAAALVLLLDPFSILDIGFWLSSGAVLVIALASRSSISTSDSRAFDSRGTDDSRHSLIRLQPVLWLGMMPLTTLFFGQISLISPFVNLLMVPLFCTLLIPAVLVSLLLLPLLDAQTSSLLITNLAWLFHTIYIFLSWLNELSFARYFPPATSNWQWVVLLMLGMAYFLLHNSRRLLLAIMLLLFLLPPLWRSHFDLDAHDLRVTMLDVGQGLAMLVETKGYVLLYDAGPLYPSGFSATKAVVIPYLHSRGIRKIDHFIISHADKDHLGDYQAVLDAFEVIALLSSDILKVPQATVCLAGQDWHAGDFRFELISPDQSTPNGKNNQSCVLQIVDLKMSLDELHSRVLITGDIERAAERHLLQSGLLATTDILSVPHHGSKSSSTSAFVNAASPGFALVSAAYANHFNHPNPAVVSRYQTQGAEMVNTISAGSSIFEFNGMNWQITKYRVQNKAFWRR